MRFHEIGRGRREVARPDRRAKARRAAGAPALEALEGRVVLSTASTWSGAAGVHWTDSGNWDTLPVSGSDLSFPATASNKTNTNDFAAGTAFGAVGFAGAGYAIGGNSATFAGPITASQASGTDALDVPIQLAGTLPITVSHAGAELDLGGDVGETGGSHGLSVTGPGTVVLSGANTYTGPTVVTAAGTLIVDGPQASSAVSIGGGSTLGGTGTVASITSTGGIIKPGDNGTGILVDAGALKLDAASTFSSAYSGPGTDHAELDVAGPVTLAGALTLKLNATPTNNEQITLIHNTSGSAITGTFTNAPEGAELTFGGQVFRISYASGATGHDVVLTRLNSTATTVVASSSTPDFGTSVTLTATVVGSGASGTPTGSVEFFQGTKDLGSGTLNASGVATLGTSALPVGTDQVTAAYQGSTAYAKSTSSPITVTVAKAQTTTALVVQPTTAVFGTPVTLKATVAPTTSGLGTPTGTVEFFNGATEIQTARLDATGSVSITTSSLQAGSDAIKAVYLSDNTFATSTSPVVQATVTAAPTTTTLVVSPTSPLLGQAVTLTVAVTPNVVGAGVPGGTVTFFDGSTSLGTGTLNSSGLATLTTSALTGGANVLTAVYAGAGNFATSTSAATTATVPQASSTTTLSITPNPAFPGQSVSLQAAVFGVNTGTVIPTGTVQFFAGGTPLGTANVTGGVATLQSTTLPIGTTAITADYQGSSSFAASASTAVAAVVAPAVATITLTPTIPNPGPTQTEVFNVSVSSAATGVTPTGTVTLYANGTPIGQATLSNGSGTVKASNLPIGHTVISAVYSGDTTNGATASASTLPVGTAIEQYLNAVYLQALGRPIDAGQILTINSGGLAGWFTQYVEGGAFRRPVVTRIVHSKEPRQFAVQATYQNVAAKNANHGQLANAQLGSNGTTVNLYSRVFGGPSYYRKVGASVNAYLEALGTDLLGGPLPAAQAARYRAELLHGTPRSTVVGQLLQSPVGKAAQVNGLYQKTLARQADAAGLRFNVGVLNQGQSDDQVLINLLSSPEFYADATSAPSTTG